MLRLFAPHPVLFGRGIRDECIKELHQKLDQVNAQVLEDSKAGEIMFLPTLLANISIFFDTVLTG